MHRKWSLALGIASLATLGLFAVALAHGADGDKTVTITEKDKSDKIELAKGDTLVIKLAANPTTGFTWVIASKENDILKAKGEPKYEAADKDKKLVGGGGIMTFTFTATAAGEVPLELHYKRTFEKDKEPAKTMKWKVIVK